MARFRNISLALAATLLLAAPAAWAADPAKNDKQPDVKVESPTVVDPDVDPTRDSSILSRSAAKRRGENPDAAGAGGDTGETPRTSTRCWDGACARSDWTNGIKNNRGPNVTTSRGG
ncbi:MAG: hypothetical protein JWM77_4169 [Rhodospirillales bacterium]|jgi:hypothetical protein|nr:hypothetical protein [Rhodospirillales bacterium]